MAIIENFAELSEQEQRAFAETLMKTINSEHIFTGESDLTVTEVDADDMDGGLYIVATNTAPIEVVRSATWQADEESVYSPEPDLVDYADDIYTTVERTFKIKETTIGDYYVALSEVSDVDAEVEDVDVDSMSHEDSGIGSYEYWGEVGYDSHPYVEAEGTITVSCTCDFVFYVVAADTPAPVETDEE
jgi:hypothetical protein